MLDRQRLLVPLLVALAAYAVVAFTPQIFDDGDTYWHIAAGARMLADRAVLFRDPFSYTFAGAPWNAHEWLSEIAMALAYRAAGWGGEALLCALAFAAAAGFLAFHLGRWFALPARLLILALALSCMAGSLLARPHILALPLLELWTAGLVIARSEKRAPTFFLLPVMTLWANLHGGFVFGFLLLGCVGLEALVDEPDKLKTVKAWGLFAAASVMAALITPHFIDGLLFPFRLLAMSGLAHVGEWQPTSFATPQPFELVVLAALYVFLSRGVKLPVFRVLISLLLLHMALQHVRHQLVFAMAVPLLLAEPLSRALDSRTMPANTDRGWDFAWLFAALVLAIGISAARLSLALPRGGDAVTPQAALAHVPQSLAETPMLNDYGFGGYLIFSGRRPFIDSRAELYGDDFLRNYARIVQPDAAALKATLQRYRIRWTIFAPDSPTVALLDLLPGWHRLYADKIAVVHVRDG